MSSENGRTFWDLLYINRKYILLIVVAVTAFLLYRYIDENYRAEASAFLDDYWTILLSPLVGYILGNKVAKKLYRPSCRLLIHLDVETHTVRPIMVPEEIFKTLTQTGNGVVFHTAYGVPAYLVKDLDFSTGEVSYGWIHTLSPMIVMEREEAFVKWDETLSTVLSENLILMNHPHVIGLGYARQSLRDHLDSFGEVLGFNKVDLDGHEPAPRPEPETGTVEEEVPDDQ